MPGLRAQKSRRSGRKTNAPPDQVLGEGCSERRFLPRHYDSAEPVHRVTGARRRWLTLRPKLHRQVGVILGRPRGGVWARWPAVFSWEETGEEFDLARALIEARSAAGLSHSQLARRMKTSQSYTARIEGGRVRPSTDALERFAQATRTRLRIVFEPSAAR